MSLHELSSGGKGLQGSEVLLYSRYYRSALHECVLGLRAEARKRMAERELPGPSQYEQQAELFATMGLVWHLIEILFIEVWLVCTWWCGCVHAVCHPLPAGAPGRLPGAAAGGVGVLGGAGGGERAAAGHLGPHPSREQRGLLDNGLPPGTHWEAE